ncbi:hypothetical protein GGI07_005689 [Coemansia sp. Benny D115]|nr:hypothetical protein GGI07_005689 [Coemansia sp. Benny D115]
MSRHRLESSLIRALQGCPLLFGRFRVHADSTIWLEYDPENSNPPTLEFQTLTDIRYADIEAAGFSYAVARKHGIAMDIPDGSVSGRGEGDVPLFMARVSFLADGGVAVFNMTHHVAFDGNAVFSFMAYWAQCNREASALMDENLQCYETSLVTNTGQAPEQGPVEISVDATRTPKELAEHIARKVRPEDLRASVFEIHVARVAELKTKVEESGLLGPGEWVSSNNALTGFVVQCVARANMEAQVYEPGDWTVFQSLDMRRPLGLPLKGLGSPIILAEFQARFESIQQSDQFAHLAVMVRRSLEKYTGQYLQGAMDWMSAAYTRLSESGAVDEPWRHFWFTAMNTNRRAVGVSCMNKIPVYETDFGAGKPKMARSFNPRPNYVIVFPGPPSTASGGSAHETLHLYVTLEAPAMEALCADPEWTSRCTHISKG